MPSKDLSAQRVMELLHELSSQGYTQGEVAGKIGVPAQYHSDIKNGRRPVTELVARRLGEQFGRNYRWLLGSAELHQDARRIGLPLFPHPIEGDPRSHPAWKGERVEVAGEAEPKVARAKDPYVVRFGHNDVQGRIWKGDLILVSQEPFVATISIVKFRSKLFLARRRPDELWERVGNGASLPAKCPVVGHCIGIVWGSLY
jgi:hypothetical protein